MSTHFIWSTDPVLLQLGPFAVRYYGICFGIALVTGFLIWNKRVQRFGESAEFAERLIWFGIPGVIIGGRLGHVIFYAPQAYLADPLRVFAIWEGGTSSHGVGIGLAIGLWVFSRRAQITWTKLGDYFAPAAALAVGWVRLGNFFNSEVLGHATNVPWAIVFTRHDDLPRHPAQLYDLLIGPVAYLVITAVERRNIRPIGSGLVAGTFLTVYFSLRIFVERYKEHAVEVWQQLAPFVAIERWVGVPINPGQWLSVLPVLAGVYMIVRAMRNSEVQRADDQGRP